MMNNFNIVDYHMSDQWCEQCANHEADFQVIFFGVVKKFCCECVAQLGIEVIGTLK